MKRGSTLIVGRHGDADEFRASRSTIPRADVVAVPGRRRGGRVAVDASERARRG
jgi:hypothetical protein